jgi:CheY-like chemotaxis protein
MKRILIVDDYHPNRAWIRELIGTLHPQARVLEAQNGREGLALAFSEQPDFILLDVHMPLMDGYETARALRAVPQTQAIPLIGMTLAADEYSPTLARLRPFCHAILFKPFYAAQLDAALENLRKVTNPRKFMEADICPSLYNF